MSGEHSASRGRLPRLGKRKTVGFHQTAHPLQGQEGSVAFVDVVDSWLQAEGLQSPVTTDAQHNLLFDAHLQTATVQLVGDVPVVWAVGRNIRIQQVKRYAAYLDPPHLGGHPPAGVGDLNRQWRPVRTAF